MFRNCFELVLKCFESGFETDFETNFETGFERGFETNFDTGFETGWVVLVVDRTKDVEFRKIAYKALCCDHLKVTSQLVSFQSQNLSLV